MYAQKEKEKEEKKKNKTKRKKTKYFLKANQEQTFLFGNVTGKHKR